MGKWRYGVILDAGSSGTRLHIYRWLSSAKAKAVASKDDLHRLPVLRTKKKWTKKTHPGISAFADTPDRVGPEHLAPLFEHTLNQIPEEEIENTPIFLLATAGVRLLPVMQRNALLNEVCSYTRKSTKFQLPDCDLHIQAIPGETEGLYGWIATNYLLGGFDFPEAHAHGKGHHTYGFLDMGGASAQIAFAPNATEAEKHRNDLKLLRLRTLDGAPSEYKVFVTTWLEYGVNEARRRYVQSLLDSTDTERSKELPDPCLPVGLTVAKNGQVIKPGSDEAKGKESYLLGTGKFAECLSQTLPLLDKNAACNDPPCLFHGVHVPAIDFDVNHFVGVSEYWHTTHEVFEAAFKDKAYDFHTYQSRVEEFCSQDWSAVTSGLKSQLWGTKFDETTAIEVCFKASWLINMLHEGIGIPRVGIEADSHVSKGQHNGTKEILDKAKQQGYLAPFQAVNKIDDTEVSWTLGKMVLYASSQVPPANNASLAVGFGSNVPNIIPNDFQYAGGRADTMAPDKGADYDGDADDDLDWQDKILNTSNLPRRAPGFLLVLFIVLVVAFLLCGRDRRANLFRKIGGLFRRNRRDSIGSSPRRRRGLASKLPFLGSANSSGPKYDRVMEEGEIQHPSDFELAALSSSSESDDGKSSGGGSRRTPHTRHMTPKKRPSTPSTGAGIGPGGFSAGLGSGASGSYSDSPARATNVNIVAQGVGLGLGPVGGFRTQSSDRLDRIGRGGGESTVAAATATGTRSRAGSPTRWRSPLLMPPKENLD